MTTTANAAVIEQIATEQAARQPEIENSGSVVGVAPSKVFPVRVWTDGGTTDGDKTTQCDRTYTVRSLEATDPATGGQLLGSAMTPDKRRPPIGKLSIPLAAGAGEVGIGYFTSSSGTLTFHLFDANETLDTEAC